MSLQKWVKGLSAEGFQSREERETEIREGFLGPILPRERGALPQSRFLGHRTSRTGWKDCRAVWHDVSFNLVTSIYTCSQVRVRKWFQEPKWSSCHNSQEDMPQGLGSWTCSFHNLCCHWELTGWALWLWCLKDKYFPYKTVPKHVNYFF